MTLPLHVAEDEGALPFVWRDDADLLWPQASIEEGCDDLLDVASFGPVEERGAGCGDFFVTDRVIEEHGLLLGRPWEVETFEDSLVL